MTLNLSAKNTRNNNNTKKIISYPEFSSLLNSRLYGQKDFYVSLLENAIDHPFRYCGPFRLSSIKTKLLQNLIQSREIKFGELIEEIATRYISKLGYANYDKRLGKNNDGEVLIADQFFTDSNTLFLTERKVRDDHDSTKKRGQYQNFREKVKLIKEKHPHAHINASRWFVDDLSMKNRKFYLGERQKSLKGLTNVSLHLYYGSEYFDSLKNGHGVWKELVGHLAKYKLAHANADTMEIPDLGTSNEIYEALISLPQTYWNKLTSNKHDYVQLRNELFSSGDNLLKATLKRAEQTCWQE